MRIEHDTKLDFKDVLIRPKRSTLCSRNEVQVDRTYIMKHSKRVWKGCPLMTANMDTVGTFEMAVALSKHQIITTVHKHYTIQDWQNFYHNMGGKDTMDYVVPTTGLSESDINKLDEIIRLTDAPAFCMDVANGYSQAFVVTLRSLRAKYPDRTIFAGNVVTGEMTEELIMSGADVVKVGIGPGSVCTTRLQTGVGYPQLSAIIECADAAHGLGGLIIADGGCVSPGDIAKGFGAGADFVMLGGMLAGHTETAGDIVEENGQWFKIFYGMSSDTAMTKYQGTVARYRSSEGKTVKVPFKGPVEAAALDIMGGIRSACTYIGASSLKEMSKRTTFVRVTQQGNASFDGHEITETDSKTKGETRVSTSATTP